MQLDSLHSDPNPPSTIQQDPSPAPTVLTAAATSSDPASLSRDLSSTFQSSLQPFLDSILLNSNGCSNNINKNKSSNKTNNSDSNSIIINNNNNNNITNNTNAIIITQTETVTGHRIIINDENKSKTTTSNNDNNYKNSNNCKRSQESIQFSIQNATQPLDLIEQDSCCRYQHQNQYPRKYFSTTTVCSSSSPSPASSSSLSARTTESSTSSSPSPPSTDRGANQQDEETTKDQLGSETQLQGRNKDREISKSPLLAHHPHIIYPTIASTTTATTAAATMIEFAAAATTVTAKVSKDQDLDHGPQGFVPHQQQQQQQNDNHPVESQEHNTQLCNSSNGFSFAACSFIISAQSDLSLSCGMSPPTPIVPSQAPLNTTNSRGEDGHLQIAQEQWDETLDPCGNEAQTDGGYISDDLVDSLAIGKERKRLTRAEGDGDTFKKRRKDRIQEKPGTASFALTTMTKTKTKTATTNHLLHFLEIQLDQTAYQTSKGKREPALKQETTLDFDPSAVARSWTTPRRRNAHSKCGKPHYPPQYHGNQSNTYFCTQHQAADQHCQCRKRSFADAIELSRPLSANHCTVDHHPTWIESVKKRKIHQNPTKWTSTLSPAPYIKLLTVRDLWDVMETRMDLSWLADEELWGDCSDSVVESPLAVNCDPSTMEIAPSLAEITPDHPEEQVNAKDQAKKHRRSECRKIIRQCPCPSQFLRGLWEEELKEQRLRQMIPDTVRRPPRSKIFNSRPIATGPKNIKPSLPSLLTPSPSSESSPMSSVPTTPTGSDNASDTSAEEQSPQSSLTDLELSLKKKHRAAAIIRSHAITEGSDMSEYRPWKDGTVIPHQGSLCSLKELRCNIMDPWPAEEAKSKDECTRILHRMREQLNVVINLQIHLRSMIKTAPTQWSFLLSIRHPGQVSIELLLALYGPHFMQTSNFRAIEQLLWGTKGSHQPQPETDGSSSLLHA